MPSLSTLTRLTVAVLALTLFSTGCASPSTTQIARADWRTELHQQLPLLGHRNWVVIADSAYPLQSRAGITTVYTDADQVDVVSEVLKSINSSGHVSPIVSMDQELAHVTEADAPGVDTYRQRINKALDGRPVKTEPHIEIIKNLDETAKLFNVLVLKTKLKVPYTSVFIQLDCAYWNGDKEKRLREKE